MEQSLIQQNTACPLLSGYASVQNQSELPAYRKKRHREEMMQKKHLLYPSFFKPFKNSAHMVKSKGLIGENATKLPQWVRNECESSSLINGLYATSIGHYLFTKDHYEEQKNGVDHHILIFCTEGSGGANIEGRDYIVNALQYLIIPAQSAHRYWPCNNQPWNIYCLHFNGSNADVLSGFLYKQMAEGKNSVLYGSQIINTFYKILNILQSGYSYHNLLQASLMLPNYLSFFIFPESKVQVKKEYEDESTIAIINYLKNNIDKRLTLTEIASYANYSPTHLSSKFKKMSGYSLIEYFNHLKLQKACQLLLFTQKRINEIATEIGIEDPYYFSRLFSKHLGISPSEFRDTKQIKNTAV